MARVFDDLEFGYLHDVLESGKLGWYHEEGSMSTRFEEAFAAKIGTNFAVARNSAMTAGLDTKLNCRPNSDHHRRVQFILATDSGSVRSVK